MKQTDIKRLFPRLLFHSHWGENIKIGLEASYHAAILTANTWV